MQIKNTFERYGVVAKGFHWLMALLIVVVLAIGLYMADMDNSPDKFRLYGLHKSTGIMVLFLAVFRLGWKLANVAPILPVHMRKIEVFLARCGHAALYMFMFVMPLTGWIMSSAAGFPVSVYGWFVLPDLIAPNKEIAQEIKELHELAAWVLMAIVSLHVIAALLHHVVHKDNILRRMLPFCKGSSYAQDSDVNVGC